jgi:hypothetical protein
MKEFHGIVTLENVSGYWDLEISVFLTIFKQTKLP